MLNLANVIIDATLPLFSRVLLAENLPRPFFHAELPFIFAQARRAKVKKVRKVIGNLIVECTLWNPYSAVYVMHLAYIFRNSGFAVVRLIFCWFYNTKSWWVTLSHVLLLLTFDHMWLTLQNFYLSFLNCIWSYITKSCFCCSESYRFLLLLFLHCMLIALHSIQMMQYIQHIPQTKISEWISMGIKANVYPKNIFQLFCPYMNLFWYIGKPDKILLM